MEPDDIGDLFAAFGPVVVKRMFGGRGLYADGLMFALEARGVLYLKADAAFAEQLAKRGSEPFSYGTAKGTRTIASFWRVPEAAMDDPEDLAELARSALSAARTDRAARPRKAGASRKAVPVGEEGEAPKRSAPSKRRRAPQG